MTRITREELDEFQEQARGHEREFLVSLMLESDNENVLELLEETLMVAKLVHGEELEEKISDCKTSLIRQRYDSIMALKQQQIMMDMQNKIMNAKMKAFDEQEKKCEELVESSKRNVQRIQDWKIGGEKPCDSSQEVAAKSWLQTFRNILTSR